MSAAQAKLGHASTGFAIAGGITVLFSTLLAWAKDAYPPLNSFMNMLAWNNWVTQGLADVVLFFVLGLIFSKAGWTERVVPNSVISFLAVAVVVDGVGLFVWYAVF